MHTITYHTANSTIAIPVAVLQVVILTPSNDGTVAVSTKTNTFPATFRVAGNSFGLVSVSLTAVDANKDSAVTTDALYYPDNPDMNTVNINTKSFSSMQLIIKGQGAESGDIQTPFSLTHLYYSFSGESVNVDWRYE